MGVRIYNTINKNVRVGKRILYPELTPVTDAGVYFPEYGGYYSGVNINVDSTEYAIIVEPINGISVSRGICSDTNEAFEGSLYDGRSNTQEMVNRGISNFPAAEYCVNLTTNGFTDWHLPSLLELEACYRYLKPSTTLNSSSLSTRTNSYTNPVLQSGDHSTTSPSQTNISEFQEGNTEAFDSTLYFSSSITFGSFYKSNIISFDDGGFLTSGLGGSRNIRAVRWVDVNNIG